MFFYVLIHRIVFWKLALNNCPIRTEILICLLFWPSLTLSGPNIPLIWRGPASDSPPAGINFFADDRYLHILQPPVFFYDSISSLYSQISVDKTGKSAQNSQKVGKTTKKWAKQTKSRKNSQKSDEKVKTWTKQPICQFLMNKTDNKLLKRSLFVFAKRDQKIYNLLAVLPIF